MHEAILYKKREGKKTKCLACRQACIISPGKIGICGVRQNTDGKLYLLVYGKAAAVNVDPIEKKPFFHFMPGTEALSIGTLGCNFSCKFCQNSDISQATRNKKIIKISELGQDLPPEKIVQACKDGRIPTIAYTYNEPTVFFEYVYDTAVMASKEGIKNVLVSNGYATDEALDMLKPYVQAMNIDLKSFSDKFYKETCGARLQGVLDTIKHAHKLGIWIEITTLVIPGKNDSEKELSQIAEFIASVDKEIPWHVSAFFPNYKMMSLNSTPSETLEKAYSIGKKKGLRYVYLGNVRAEKYYNTHCPECDKLLVKREGYFVTEMKIDENKCSRCGERIKGVWE